MAAGRDAVERGAFREAYELLGAARESLAPEDLERLAEAYDDYAGQGVHVAARIGALAGGGEILASRESLNDGGARFPISEAQKAELKGIADAVELVSIGWR